MPAEPNYDRDIAVLVAAFKTAVDRIRAELLRLDITDMSRANSAVALREVGRILSGLNAESAAWVAEHIPEAAKDGIVRAIVDLGVADTIEAAEKIAKFNRINSEMVKAAITDTQADLLAVTQNVDRRVKAAVRKATADSMRANMAAGINGRRAINRDTLDNMRKTLGDAVDTGIIDAGGRRWKPDVYVDMVTRTKMNATSREATENEALNRGAMYGVISRHGATDACGPWEGRIVKLVPDAPGDYPYIGNIPRNQLFHPNCKHLVTAVRDPARVRN